MVSRLLVLLIFLISSSFFSLVLFPRQILLVLLFGGAAFIILTVIINLIYFGNKKKFKHNFGLEISFFLISTVLAMFGAKWGHGQDIILSVWIQVNMYYFFFYFFLHVLRIRPEDIERLMIVMAVSWIFLFMVQYVIYPRLIFNTRIAVERGTVRIFVPGGSFASLMYYYFLLMYFRTRKLKYLSFCFAYLMVPVLQGTRSSILTELLGTLIFVLFSRQVKSRISILIMMGFGMVLIFFLFQDIFINLIEVSEGQAQQEGEDIRVRSAKFFLTEFYPNKLNYIIGNGDGHMLSSYGRQIMYYKSTLGFYQSDIGIIGAYVKYGVLHVIAIFMMVRKIFITEIEPRYIYIKYFTVLLTSGLIMGQPFVQPFSIVAIMSMIYIIDVSNYQLMYKYTHGDKDE